MSRWILLSLILAAGCEGCPSGGGADDDGAPEPDAPLAPVCPGPRVAQVSLSVDVGAHACAVTDDGVARCWGSNFDGELGRGTVQQAGDPFPGPAPVIDLDGETAQIEVGDGFTCARQVGGEVFCWGRNQLGQLGDGAAPQARSSPALTPILDDATTLEAGRYATCALVAGDDAARCWGYDMISTLVDPELRATPAVEARLAAPEAISLAEADLCGVAGGAVTCAGALGPFGPGAVDAVARLGAGHRHHCVARADGAVTCMGQNFDGQLGDGGVVDAPGGVEVAGFTGATALAGGWGHTCALDEAGAVWCWGSGPGQLGGEGPTPPTRVAGLAEVVALDAGYDSTCAITVAGDLRCWGRYPQAGAQNPPTVTEPTCVPVE
jgi:alpha-tubulin suppressor-like RCC1 family protein